MKLTPDQIEVERKKFEAVYLKSHGFHGCFYRVEAVFQYVHSNVENCFQFWLACRESNNEIELPKPMVEFDGMDEPSYYYRPSTISQALQSQGYTIKSNAGVNTMQHNADEALGKQLDVYAKPADHNLVTIFNIRAEAEAETERKIQPYREAHAEVVAAENVQIRNQASADNDWTEDCR